MAKLLTELEKIGIFLLSIALIVYLLVSLKIWSHDLGGYFFKAGRWYEFIFVLAVGYILSKVIELLIKWQARNLDQGKVIGHRRQSGKHRILRKKKA